MTISIHALREEGDVPAYQLAGEDTNFYPRPPRGGRRNAADDASGGDEFLSTPSSRRATHIDLARDLACDISIHALLTEGDLCPWSGIVFAHISIHALLTEGDVCAHGPVSFSPIFLSTPSSRRATDYYWPVLANIGISIHALLTEGDPPSSKSGRPSENFYPRPPRGGRRWPPSPTP